MLLGLHGKKQAGKDTVYARILHLLGPDSPAGATVERRGFADKLYESAAAALGVDVDYLRGNKTEPHARVVVGIQYDGLGITHPVADISLREYLQRYGTEAHRDVFGSNFWVDAVDLEHEGRVVCVTDVRFENEAQAVSDAGGYVVHVVGPDAVENTGDAHASETPLPHWRIDYQLMNDLRDDGFRSLDAQVLELCLTLLREEQRCS